MRALARRGLDVAPFKCGPDFIDPGLHAAACGRTSHNLDGWILGQDSVRSIFSRHSAGADIAVIEGVMGLHDGASGSSRSGSTAETAAWLDAPVLLVVDAGSMARSAAAVVAGYTSLDPELRFAGVVFNRAGSANHRDLLAEAVRTHCPEIPVHGFLPRDASLNMPSRHLGLITAEDAEAGMFDRLADWVESALDIDALLESARSAGSKTAPAQDSAASFPASGETAAQGAPSEIPDTGSPSKKVRIGVARDRAFCFYYAENLRLLEEAGATLAFFSPLADSALPEGLDGLYLGGGYPELHAESLSQNKSMLAAIRGFCASGRPVLAECGGYMYLMDSIRTSPDTDQEETTFPMAGVFPFRCAMTPRFRALGYREAVTAASSPLGPAGTVIRGHEFHYSAILDEAPSDGKPSESDNLSGLQFVYDLSDRKGPICTQEGALIGNVLGSYVHLHFASNPAVPVSFVTACRLHSGKLRPEDTAESPVDPLTPEDDGEH